MATHLGVLALLVFGLPLPQPSPSQEPAVDVQLVPPPQPAEPVKPEPPKPAPEPKQAEATPEPSPQAAPQPSSTVAPMPVPVMQPVLEFGDKDSGPRQTADGDSTEDAAQKPEPEKVAEEPAKPSQEKRAEAETGDRPATTAEEPPAEATVNEPSPTPKRATGKLAKARTLFSTAMSNDPVARTAIGKIPRDRRGGTLCGTELREQLVRGSPSHVPELLPALRLTSGTVIAVNAAFHADGQWRAVAFRCQVDADAMKVVSFSLGVGDLIPRSDWKRLGLPSQ